MKPFAVALTVAALVAASSAPAADWPKEYRVIAVPAGIPDRASERLVAAAKQASRSERFRRVTEDNTNFPLVFRDQEETEAAIRRIRAANEAVLGD